MFPVPLGGGTSAGLAAIAGSLVSLGYSISPSIGLGWTLKALIVVVLAGLGSMRGIIVAGIGRTTGVIDTELFTVIVGMSILTTLAVPPLLRALAPAPPAPAQS